MRRRRGCARARSARSLRCLFSNQLQNLNDAPTRAQPDQPVDDPVLAEVHQRRQHHHREQQHDRLQPHRLDHRQEERRDEQREGSVQRRHRRDGVAPVERASASPSRTRGSPRSLKPRPVVRASGGNRRYGYFSLEAIHGGTVGIDDEHQACNDQQAGEPAHEAHELHPADRPDHGEGDDRDDEVRVVHDRGDVVVPADVVRVVEVLLHPHVRVVTEEQRPVDVARRLHLQRDTPRLAYGGAAGSSRSRTTSPRTATRRSAGSPTGARACRRTRTAGRCRPRSRPRCDR